MKIVKQSDSLIVIDDIDRQILFNAIQLLNSHIKVNKSLINSKWNATGEEILIKVNKNFTICINNSEYIARLKDMAHTI